MPQPGLPLERRFRTFPPLPPNREVRPEAAAPGMFGRSEGCSRGTVSHAAMTEAGGKSGLLVPQVGYLIASAKLAEQVVQVHLIRSRPADHSTGPLCVLLTASSDGDGWPPGHYHE